MDFTIVTPSFNQAQFLPKTLESVLSQAGDFSLDYIVMDGGSEDESTEILRDYDERVRCGKWRPRCRRLRFRWQSERDRGQAHAVNKGFQLAEGDTLGWLNSDDIYENDQTLAKVHRHFSSSRDSQFVYGRGYRMDATGTREKEEWYVTAFNVEDLPEICYILQPSAFWRKELFTVAGPLDESMHFAFDWDFWIRCSRHAKLELLDEFLSCNRVYSATKTNCGGMKRKAEIAQLLLKHGGFTQRAINAYLVDHAHPSPKPTRQFRKDLGRALRGAPRALLHLPWTLGTAWQRRKVIARTLLTPTRAVERAVRRTLRARAA
ncbi:MAG: glycosyltransferase family 2 protein [Pirellulales bacterium]